jgi:hypothetical protein
MPLTRTLIPSAGLAALMLGLSACTLPDTDARLPRQPSNAAAKSWIERRANELAASGLSPSDAAVKASDEWAHRNLDGTGPDTYVLYNSNAKAKAEQKELNEGLEKMQRARN